MANDTTISISGEDAGLQAALGRAESAVRGAVGSMQSSLNGLQGAFMKINLAFGALAAVLAGGAAFKKAVETTVDLTKESVSLAKQFGISATEASVLKVALDDVFVSQDTLSAAGNRISQTLKKNESAFHDLGVATRDGNGHFRNTFDIIQDVNARLLQFKEGTDRNVEGAKIYGKAWGEVAPTLKLTATAIAEAQAKAASLGLVVGDESVEATKKYRSAMNDVHDVFLGVQKAIGDAVLPALTQLGEWFADIGPDLVRAFQRAIAAVRTEFALLVAGFKILWDAGSEVFKFFGTLVTTIEESKQAMLRGDFSGAVNIWKEGFKKIKSDGADTWAKIKQDAMDASKSIGDAWDRVDHQDTVSSRNSSATKTSDGGDEEKQNLMARLREKLEMEKLADAERQRDAGTDREYTKQQEIQFWQDSLTRYKLTEQQRREISRNILSLQIEIYRQQSAAELASLKEQENLFRNNLEARLVAAQAYEARVRQIKGDDSVEAAKAAGEVLQIQAEMITQQRQLDEAAAASRQQLALAEVDAKSRQAQYEHDIGASTNLELLDQERDFANQRLEIQRTALIEKLQLAAQDPDRNLSEIQNINAQILALETQHSAELDAIQKQRLLEQRRGWDNLFDSIRSGFQRNILEFTRGNLTIAGLFKGLFTSVADSLGQMVAKNIANLAVQVIFGRTAALKELQASAVAAAGKAYEAVVGIPYVGPFLAPAAAAAAYAGVLAFGSSLPSAAGGFDIPAGVSPITQLHEREMVLPAKHADVIRSLADAPGDRPGGVTHNHHWNVSAIDAKSFRKAIRDPNNGVMAEVKQLFRTAGHTVRSN